MVPARVAPEAVRTVACVGAGVIGGGWVAYFLARGYDVVAWDPAPDAEPRLRHLVDAAWPALTELGLRRGRRAATGCASSPTSPPRWPTPTSCRRARRRTSTSRSGCWPTSTP